MGQFIGLAEANKIAQVVVAVTVQIAFEIALGVGEIRENGALPVFERGPVGAGNHGVASKIARWNGSASVLYLDIELRAPDER